MNTPPVCPKCGRTPDKISERLASSGGTFFSAKKTSDNSLICTYRCECGTMFTRTERHEEAHHEQHDGKHHEQREDKSHDQHA